MNADLRPVHLLFKLVPISRLIKLTSIMTAELMSPDLSSHDLTVTTVRHTCWIADLSRARLQTLRLQVHSWCGVTYATIFIILSGTCKWLFGPSSTISSEVTAVTFNWHSTPESIRPLLAWPKFHTYAHAICLLYFT